MSDIDIRGIDKAELLCALYNHAKPARGMGVLQHINGDLPIEEARELVSKYSRYHGGAYPAMPSRCYFDYLHGRALKVAVGGDRLAPGLYDRDNGQGMAARVVAKLRARAFARQQPPDYVPGLRRRDDEQADPVIGLAVAETVADLLGGDTGDSGSTPDPDPTPDFEPGGGDFGGGGASGDW